MAVGDARLTASGHCVGTAAYLSPEQVAGGEVGPAADIYSLGLVLLECLTGQPEYVGTEIEAAVARLNRSPRIPDWLSPPWRRTLTRMTAPEPRQRADSALCVELLNECQVTPNTARIPARASMINPTKPAPAPVSRYPHLRVHHAAALLILTSAAALGSLMASGSDHTDPAAPNAPAHQMPAQPPHPSPVAAAPAPADIAVISAIVSPIPNPPNPVPPHPQEIAQYPALPNTAHQLEAGTPTRNPENRRKRLSRPANRRRDMVASSRRLECDRAGDVHVERVRGMPASVDSRRCRRGRPVWSSSTVLALGPVGPRPATAGDPRFEFRDHRPNTPAVNVWARRRIDVAADGESQRCHI
jgi:serine/threonine protein kinase